MLRLNTPETSVSPPCRNLKGLARKVSSRFTFGKRCHGLKFLARIRAKLGSRSCCCGPILPRPHQSQKGRGRGARRGGGIQQGRNWAGHNPDRAPRGGPASGDDANVIALMTFVSLSFGRSSLVQDFTFLI